ncbi:hypothetical protein A3K48_03415 [candidate division WOR-1 bacterium RIFOXYA12_FULL_52_29]|uniref:Tyr recombinase domain-containing protein n=1 Tax=candidate division WOR-1 bacterium RIFOXYC12_FULL_54_18 TaxID=1802584 RepID=A0A1F4T5E7_UNCSA|nr:MAG: hypothetical protein A3K44_03415 [candidate division WOR-1 bacterium RIFOXYA2_FULL_51_19]OGC17614.1 MAG: hypothetical protein A3K48_03415 [candidate division WOR-1 bacterium RIFOXYA12_FULL_52_29]OGC26471.1 MAG: hypothetical protein A3K32_03410 [candidate division WOR-1 bacterium RIFOXYB2_FULL_45_9]OGC28031.1 MAG: hypothetical protein A3K49_03415 [candidate division WOR-1 bacterium RIFOXYC12_FULL_54_18]OGC29683.1 MAG: hypothetical protein A2346_02920 [candidate division WOR-1 bacterium R
MRITTSRALSFEKGSKYINYWSRGIIKREIKSIHANGYSILYKNAIKSHFRLVKTAQLKRYFGGWRAAVKAAGINYYKYEALYKKKKPRINYFVDDPVARNLLWKWRRELILKNYNHLTIVLKIKWVKRFINFLKKGQKLETLTRNDAKKYLFSKKAIKYSPRTLQIIKTSLNHFFEFCVKKGILKESPFLEIDFPRYEKIMPAVLQEEDLIHLVRAIDEMPVDDLAKARGRLAIGLIVYCGLRRRELLSLKKRDVDLNEMIIKVKQGKHRKDRLLPINRKLVETIREYLRLRGNDYGRYLLSNKRNNRKMDNSQLHYLFRDISKQAGLKRVTPHLLRGTLATLLLNREASIRSIQELMGHNSIDTTARYTQVSMDLLRKEMAKHPLLVENMGE